MFVSVDVLELRVGIALGVFVVDAADFCKVFGCCTVSTSSRQYEVLDKHKS